MNKFDTAKQSIFKSLIHTCHLGGGDGSVVIESPEFKKLADDFEKFIINHDPEYWIRSNELLNKGFNIVQFYHDQEDISFCDKWDYDGYYLALFKIECYL